MKLMGLQAATKDLSFKIIGLLPAEDLMETARFLEARKLAGHEVEFEEEKLASRTSPQLVDKEAKSILVIGMPSLVPPQPKNTNPLRGSVSIFAVGEDYHVKFRREMPIFLERLKEQGIDATVQVDTGPLLERAFARKSGAGFQGKNTSLIHPRWGSMMFLGLVLVDAEVEGGFEVIQDGCATCSLCQKACPVNALDQDYKMEIKRCLSYWTQAKGHVPFDIRENWGDRIYGCDQCQQVCPWNQESFANGKQGIWEEAHPLLIEVAEMDKATFKERFTHTAAGWRGRNVLRRNALLALARPACEPVFERVVKLLKDPSPMVRGTAAWTLVKMDQDRGGALIEDLLDGEKESNVRQEWTLVLNRKTFAKMTEV